MCTVLHSFCTCNSERRSLAAAFGSALSVADVDHPVRCVLRTVLCCFCICHSERHTLATAFDFTRPVEDVDHHVLFVLCTVLRHYCAGHFKIRALAAPLGCKLSALGVDQAVQGVLCTAVLGFLARNSKFVILPKPLTLHFMLLENLTVPSLTCCPQQYHVVLWRLLIVTSRETQLARVTRALSACRYGMLAGSAYYCPLSVLSSNLGFVFVFFLHTVS